MNIFIYKKSFSKTSEKGHFALRNVLVCCVERSNKNFALKSVFKAFREFLNDNIIIGLSPTRLTRPAPKLHAYNLENVDYNR